MLAESLPKLSNEKVRVKVMHSGVGAITETRRAAGFGLECDHHRIQRAAGAQGVGTGRHEKVDIRLHSIIYELQDEMQEAMFGLLEPTSRRTTWPRRSGQRSKSRRSAQWQAVA